MTHEEAFRKLPPEVQKLRRKMGEAMMRFVKRITEMMTEGMEEKLQQITLGIPPEEEDSMDYEELRRMTQNYRIELERIARKGVEGTLPWHTLAVWTELGKERIGYFARALECVEEGRDDLPGVTEPQPNWSDTHMRADCLFEIGRVHAYEGDAAVARDFLMRALPLAQEAERLRGAAKITHDDHLEGKIAELLVQLPEDGEAG
ncbi:MAG: hypothetical protein ABI318_05670 [Chthoniobacteraceae bacterium]